MSRNIVGDHPFSDDEVEYLLARGRNYEVEQNRKDYPPKKSSAPSQLDPEIFEKVKAMEPQEVLDAIADYGLDATGEPKALKLRLAEYLQAQKDLESK